MGNGAVKYPIIAREKEDRGEPITPAGPESVRYTGQGFEPKRCGEKSLDDREGRQNRYELNTRRPTQADHPWDKILIVTASVDPIAEDYSNNSYSEF